MPPGAAPRDLLRDVHPGDRWFVAVAHPDDESFGCGSLIAWAAVRGAEVTVACATRGEAGEQRPGEPPRADLGAVREGELRRAAAALGATRVELLGYRDSGFDGDPPAGSLCAAAPEDVAAALLRLVREVRPDVVLVLDGCDGHRDHRAVRTATHLALARLGEPWPAFYEHTVPNSLLRRWLEETRPLRPDTVYHALDPATLGRPDGEVTDVLDVSTVLDRREAAIAEHRSQISPFEGLGEQLRREFLSRDFLVQVDPTASGP